MIGKLANSLKNNDVVIFWRKILHTYLTPKFLWKLVIKDYDGFVYAKNKPVSKLEWLFKNIFWFWPTLHTSAFWRDTQAGGVMGPQDYEVIPAHSQLLVDELLAIASAKEVSFLDLGCNSGRFLNALFEAGFRNLHGMDISAAAMKHMKDHNPDLFESSDVKLQTMQEYLLNADTDSIDIIYTHGATVELIPSSFPLVREICRVSRHYVVFYISESGHFYPRFWTNEFHRHGFELLKLDRENRKEFGHSLLVFEKSPSDQGV